MKTNVILNEDCLKTMSNINDNSVDLIITSPPYNKGFYANKNAKNILISGCKWKKKIDYDIYNDEMPPEEYERWQINVISECIRILKPTGSLFYNHKDIIHKGLTIPPKWVYKFKVRQQIVWDRKSSCMIDPHYFMPANEWIYWIVKDEKQVIFNKQESCFRTNMWRMNTDKNPHPAPFPYLMAANIIKCCSVSGAVVYDPFMGSGTTALAAIKQGRQYIGSEISNRYVEMANNRIKNEMSQLSLF